MSSEANQQQGEPEMKGWLAKWTNYLKGYQKRWFVLSNGLLSYYRNQAEMAHTCRGTISLVSAVIHTEDSCNFVISNGGTQTFHLKASNEIERQKWVTALELAKARAVRMMESEEDDELDMPSQMDKCELLTVLRLLHVKLEDLSMCSELIGKHGAALQRSLSDLEQLDASGAGGGTPPPPELAARVRAVNERATLFRITSTAMMNACSEYVQLAQSQGRKWVRMLQHEHEQCLRLQEMVEQLAKQHSSLERAAQEAGGGGGAGGAHSDDEEFFDAPEHSPSGAPPPSSGGKAEGGRHFLLSLPSSETPTTTKHHRRSASGFSDARNSDTDSEPEPLSSPRGPPPLRQPVVPPPTAGDSPSPPMLLQGRQRRTRIPDKPSCSLSLWSIMKNCIGKELTKIPMPVNFNEPLSTLQRLTEDYEYAELLDQAAQCADDPGLQLVYVAAFAVSSYATTANRTGKPFNPLLGETYECDRRDDLGWRAISEQVSHHPPMLAQHCEGRGWRCWQEFSMSSKFRGKYLQVVPLGVVHLELGGCHFTWHKVTTVVHNIIVGKLWVDHQGDMEIRNHTRGHVARLKFQPYSYFSREPPRRVMGLVSDPEGTHLWLLQGTWDSQLEYARVLHTSSSSSSQQGGGSGRPVIESASPEVVWKRCLPGEEYERMYNFTVLACQLNEPEEGVAPTDSRLRPDQRLMEDGSWDEANQVKLQLEEKQRAVRRQREAEAEAAAAQGRPYVGYEPVWFRKETDPITGNPIHVYQNEYWPCKEQGRWDRCPAIYLS